MKSVLIRKRIMHYMKIEEILGEFERKNVRFVRPVFVDILGRMFDFTVPVDEFEDLVKQGKGFDGSSVEGFAKIEKSDLVFFPDLDTVTILPWEYKGMERRWREAIVFGYIHDPSGNEFEGDTRGLLRRVLERHRKIGEMMCGVEMEFFIFENDEFPIPTDTGGYLRSGLYGEIRKEAQMYLNEMGIRTEFDHHEVAGSQHEIDITYTDALRMADFVVLTRYVVKRVTREYNLYASFMPKPIQGISGNGMHVHISLWKDGRNLFFDEKNGISDLGKSYIAGLIKYGKDIQAGLNQWINSYKRLAPGYEAPVYLTWGIQNRSAYIRVPGSQRGMERAMRIELRSPDPACNPYLAFSLIHSAGIKGIEECLDPPDPIDIDVFHLSETERERMGIEELSPTLEKALEHFRESELVRSTLTEHIFENFVKIKSAECRRFNRHVTDFEIINYFGML